MSEGNKLLHAIRASGRQRRQKLLDVNAHQVPPLGQASRTAEPPLWQVEKHDRSAPSSTARAIGLATIAGSSDDPRTVIDGPQFAGSQDRTGRPRASTAVHRRSAAVTTGRPSSATTSPYGHFVQADRALPNWVPSRRACASR